MQIPLNNTGQVRIFNESDIYSAASHGQHYMVDRLLLDRSVNLLVGDSGLGKTAFCMQLGLCVSTGIPFLGRDIKKKGPVLYVDAENASFTFAQSLSSLKTFLKIQDIKDLFVYSTLWTPLPQYTSLEMALEAIIKEVKPVLVLTDALRSLWEYAESGPDAATQVYRFQRKMTSLYGCSWLNNHHIRKESEKYPGASLEEDPRSWLEKASGARALINQSDTRLGMVSGETSDLICGGFARMTGPIEPFHIERVFDGEGIPLGYKHITGLSILKTDFQELYLQLPLTFRRKDLKAYLTSQKTTSSFLDECLNAGLLQPRQKGEPYQKVASS